jgi:serine phosphatase RsbU (regulator of sigma subunit)
MAVLDGNAVLGLCSKRDVGILLGSKYGFSLFANRPIRDHLRPKPIFVKVETPAHEVFTAVFAREKEAFYDDVLLLGPSGEFLGLIFTQTLINLQNRFLLESIRLLEEQGKEISRKNEQIEADLCLSRELQQALLPLSYPSFPARSPGGADTIRFHHFYRPLGIVGGDFFHIKKLSSQAVGIFIADVMGHGVRSTMVTAMLRSLLEELSDEGYKDPAGLLDHINQKLTRILIEAGKDILYATALYLVVDAGQQSIQYASAGHPLPIHVQARKNRVETLGHSNPGTVLGMFGEAVFFNAEAIYEAGDSIILFTDGIVEVEDSAGKEFGRTCLCEATRSVIGSPVNEVIDAMISRSKGFAAKGEFTDDVCVVGIDLA